MFNNSLETLNKSEYDDLEQSVSMQKAKHSKKKCKRDKSKQSTNSSTHSQNSKFKYNYK